MTSNSNQQQTPSSSKAKGMSPGEEAIFNAISDTNARVDDISGRMGALTGEVREHIVEANKVLSKVGDRVAQHGDKLAAHDGELAKLATAPTRLSKLEADMTELKAKIAAGEAALAAMAPKAGETPWYRKRGYQIGVGVAAGAVAIGGGVAVYRHYKSKAATDVVGE